MLKIQGKMLKNGSAGHAGKGDPNLILLMTRELPRTLKVIP